MAPKNTGGTTTKGNTKIRFVMLEVDSTDGNLSEIAQAITNAVRPSLAVPKMVALTSGARVAPPRDDAELGGKDDLVAQDESVEDTPEYERDGESAPGKSSTGRASRKYPMPAYLHDLDLNKGEVAFTAFAQQKAPKPNSKKYLVVAAWFKEHGGKQAITIDDVYTCYKTVGWSTNIADWDVPFRQLVKRDWMRRVQPGQYAITPIGETKVNKIAS